MKRRGIFFKMSLLTLITSCVNPCLAQEQATPQTAEISFWATITSGGTVGLLILLISLVAVAMIVDNFIRIRRANFLPEDFVTDLKSMVENGEFETAKNFCRENNSFIACIVHAGLLQQNSVLGFKGISKSIEESSERIISKYFRRLDYLAFIGSVAPMLGLLGTVTGMIKSFNQIAITEGSAKASQLAGGISEALVTTCLGLIVAIPTIFFVTYFRNRFEGFVAETETVVDDVMSVFQNTETIK